MKGGSGIAVRRPSGRLHVAEPARRGYVAACGRRITGADLVVHVGRAAERAWRLELQCRDCLALVKREHQRRRVGW